MEGWIEKAGGWTTLLWVRAHHARDWLGRGAGTRLSGPLPHPAAPPLEPPPSACQPTLSLSVPLSLSADPSVMLIDRAGSAAFLPGKSATAVPVSLKRYCKAACFDNVYFP